MESFDPLKTRSSSSSSVIRDSRDSLSISDELSSLLQQPSSPATKPVQKERQTLAKSSSTSCCAMDDDKLLRPTNEVESSLRHARSDPMLLDKDETSHQWNGVNGRRQSSSCDEIDDLLSRSEGSGAPVFFIDSSEASITSSLMDTQHKKNQKHSHYSKWLSPKSSPKSSPKNSPKNSPLMKKRHSASVALPKSSKLVSKSRAQANSPALSKRKPRSATLDALMSSSEHERCKPQLAKHFRPGVLMLKDLNPRMSIIQRTLKEREKDFCFTREIK